jgi:NDP-hexose-3-ketoreductase
MNVINFAVWTVGNHASRNILPAIDKSKKAHLVGIFTRNEEVLSIQSDLYRCHTYRDSSELVSDSKVDAVYITSPNGVHYDQVKQCLLNDKHVIVEKTALSSLKKTAEIVDLANRKGLVVMEAFMFLHHRQFLDLKDLIEKEKYGKMLFLEASFGFPHLNRNDIRYSKKLSGGALNDAGAYTVCAILNILGPNMDLMSSNLSTEEGYDVDTSGLAIFSKTGIHAVCKWIIGGSYKNEIIIWCQHGHIIVDRAFSKAESFKTNITVTQNGDVVEEILSGIDNHFINMLDNILVNDNSSLLHQADFLEQVRNGGSKVP